MKEQKPVKLADLDEALLFLDAGGDAEAWHRWEAEQTQQALRVSCANNDIMLAERSGA